MVVIENFTYGYKRSKENVFENLNLSFEKGHIYGLLGRNGVGKSTLLYAMVGLLRPKSGKVTYDDVPTALRNVSTLSQCYMLAEEFDVPKGRLSDYVTLYSPFYPNFSELDLKKYLDVFNITGNPVLKSLSMGEKKKVVICFALACNTSLLILDEPTNGLDIPSKSQFRKVVAIGACEERTIIISTHQVADIENLLDYVVVLEKRKLLLNAPVELICKKLTFGENDPNAIYAQPWMGGTYTVSENNGEAESALKLELLFNAVIAEPEKISNILK